MKEQLDLLHECVVRNALRTLSPGITVHRNNAVISKLLRDLRSAHQPETRAWVCREFREANIRCLFNIAHISSARWLPAWTMIELEWRASQERSALTDFYRCLVAADTTRRVFAFEELLAVELAHLAKFLPLAFSLNDGLLEEHGIRASRLGGATRERETLLHPDVDENGRVIGVYAFDSPNWRLPFIDDVLATSIERRYFTRDNFVRFPLPRAGEGIDIIAHMGHSGSTLLATVIEHRRGYPMLREPRELERVLNATDPSDLGTYFDVLLSSSPRPAGVKLSSGHLGHALQIRWTLEERYGCPVRLYLLSRSTGAVMARTVRSNSPTLVDKVWAAFHANPPRGAGLLVANLEGMADYIRRAEVAPTVKKVCYESMAEDISFTPAERGMVAQDQKANSEVPLTRDLTEADQELASAVQRAVDAW